MPSALSPHDRKARPQDERSVARTSEAVWLFSYVVRATALDEGTLFRLSVNAPETRGPVGLTQRADMPASVSLQLLMKAIRDVAAETLS